MNLQLLLLHNVDLLQKLTDILPLVSLWLNHLSLLRVLVHCPNAGKFLFEGFHNASFFIIIISDALHCGQRLAAVSLLNHYMDFILRPCREQDVTLSASAKG